ncbi:MAG: hypothetical protein AB7U30_06005 [Sulfuricellaceae bacterium]|jgi:hypothetical protein
MKKLFFVVTCLLAVPAFAGIAAVQGLPAAMAGVGGGAGGSAAACEKNCSAGDSQCLRACQNPALAPKKKRGPGFSLPQPMCPGGIRLQLLQNGVRPLR